jgi:glycosyltransferase involved in cell wall biosynthesis
MIMDNQKLHFSIIIPTFQRPSRRLNACLQALCDLDYPMDCFEVILIDDGSPVSPVEIVLKYKDSLAITLYEESHIGPAKLRNLGATYARGSYLAFTDDDCQPMKNWLQIAARHFETHPNHAISGKSLLALRDNIFSSASHVLVDYLHKFYNKDPDKALFLDSNNMIVKKDLFQTVEGFTTKFSLGGAGADREFSDRWVKSGYTAQFIPELCVYHSHELSFKSFWGQQFNYGRAAFYYRRSKNHPSNRSFKLEKLSFYLCLLYHPFKVDKGIRAIVLHLLVIMSQLAICFGYVSEKVKSSQRENSSDST